MNIDYTIVLPAKNEADNLATLIPKIKELYPNVDIIVVDDGSTDNTAEVARSNDATVISHPYSMGNGAAIKTGARMCTTECVVFMDADGQHAPEDIVKLSEKYEEGHLMVVGARNSNTHASLMRKFANFLYNKIASLITGHKILDLTSGFRIVNRDAFSQFLYLLPNGFSYPTTSTMAFFRSGLSVAYVPIDAKKRKGKSHINPLKDGLRFLVIILKIGSLYSPLKFFTPPSIIIFLLGIANYAYTYMTQNTFTNMSALLMIVSIIIFMFGLLAEQLTILLYASSERRKSDRP